jgi:hypothetical protein
MCVLRVGAVGPGETPLSNTAINREEDEPPRINKQMRRAKLNLAVDLTIKLRSFDDPCMEDLLDVLDSTFYEKPTSFQAGDLVFLAVIMGKDKFSLSWCNWCKYSKAEWQVDCDVNNNDMFWDINGINVQPDCNVAHGFTDAHMQVVWSSPKTLIPFLRSIFSGMHAGIGIGNRLVNHLKEVIDVDDENILHKEFQLCASKESSKNDIKHLRHFKEVWTKSPDGGRLLQKKRDKIKQLDVELNQS